MTHSEHGVQILANFVFNICKAEKNRDTTTSTKQILTEIVEKVGKRNVFMLVSGGVDSMVAFTLLNTALGADRCYGLCIDNGLMRHEEVQAVAASLAKLGYHNFHVHDASALFLSRLAGVFEPEAKRKIIGNTFLDVQQEVVASLQFDPEQRLLGQGTIYPDIIESQGTKHASLIKTHHNRVPLIQDLIKQGKVIEPLMHLYKDEVRAVGLEI